MTSTSTGFYIMVENDSDSSIIEVNDDSPHSVAKWWIKDLGLNESDCGVYFNRTMSSQRISMLHKKKSVRETFYEAV